MKNGFSEAGARDFLKVYDATITYANLSLSDKVDVEENVDQEDADEFGVDVHIKAQDTAGAASMMDAMAGRERSEHQGQKPAHEAEPPAGIRREIITLDEGDVVIWYPDDLSSESFDDLNDHLELFIKKMKRRVSSRDQH